MSFWKPEKRGWLQREHNMSSNETPTTCEHPPEDIEYDSGHMVPPYGWEIYPGWYCLKCGDQMTDAREDAE